MADCHIVVPGGVSYECALAGASEPEDGDPDRVVIDVVRQRFLKGCFDPAGDTCEG